MGLLGLDTLRIRNYLDSERWRYLAVINGSSCFEIPGLARQAKHFSRVAECEAKNEALVREKNALRLLYSKSTGLTRTDIIAPSTLATIHISCR
jgi:hypothetical protein